MSRRVTLTVDVLVVGAGLAGLRAAAEARRFGAKVLLVDKGLTGLSGNSAFAGGGFKTCLPGMDTLIEKQYLTPEGHFQDTIQYRRLHERAASGGGADHRGAGEGPRA